MVESTPIPQTMKAWVYSANGPPSKVLTLNPKREAPRTPTGVELVIRVSHAALNPVGAVTMATIPSIMRDCPSVPEIDFAGVVVAAGPQAPSEFPVGSKICGAYTVAANRKGLGSLTEYILVSEETAGLSRVPEGMDLADASGLHCTGQTAVKMCERAGIKGDERVLLNGASGGVGTMVLQVLKAMGAKEVVAICSERNADLVRKLGADEVHYPV
jgi:NADPH:quinone reductase-like Zn-dependent oxidoreductase